MEGCQRGSIFAVKNSDLFRSRTTLLRRSK